MGVCTHFIEKSIITSAVDSVMELCTSCAQQIVDTHAHLFTQYLKYKRVVFCPYEMAKIVEEVVCDDL